MGGMERKVRRMPRGGALNLGADHVGDILVTIVGFGRRQPGRLFYGRNEVHAAVATLSLETLQKELVRLKDRLPVLLTECDTESQANPFSFACAQGLISHALAIRC